MDSLKKFNFNLAIFKLLHRFFNINSTSLLVKNLFDLNYLDLKDTVKILNLKNELKFSLKDNDDLSHIYLDKLLTKYKNQLFQLSIRIWYLNRDIENYNFDKFKFPFNYIKQINHLNKFFK